MGDNTKNGRFLIQKHGSGVGSGIKLTGRNQKSFAFRLKSRREELKITQKELANFVGVTKNAYQTWEVLTNPSTKYIAKLAEKLKCSTDYLLTDKESVSEEEKQIDKPESLYNKVEHKVMYIAAPDIEYKASADVFGGIVKNSIKIEVDLDGNILKIIE